MCVDVLFDTYGITIQYIFIKYLFYIFELIIHILICIYVELIENINILNIKYKCIYIGHILPSRVCIDVLFDICDISIQFRSMNNLFHIFELIIHIITCIL